MERTSILERLFQITREGYWFIDPGGLTLDLNPAMCAILGQDAEAVLGRSVFEFVDEENRLIFTEQIERRRRGIVGPYEITLTRDDGSKVSCVNNATPIYDDAGERVGSVGLWTDISDIKAAQQALALAKREAEITLQSIGDGVITTDANGAVTFMNPIAETLTGWSQRDAIGLSIDVVFKIVNEETRAPAVSPVARCLSEGVIVGLGNHTILVARDGREYFIQDSAAPIRLDDGQLRGVVLVFSDTTERQRMARAASHDAAHDALTGLVNRREFEMRLQRALDSSHQEGSSHALAYLDLDRFKVVNDTKGHGAGDELLRQLAADLGERLRQRDTLARLGGDEFGVLMEHCSLNQASRVTEGLRRAVADYRFQWEGQPFRVGASVGLVSVDANSRTITELLRRADAACYSAKEAGRNQTHVYNENDSKLAERHGEMQWVERIQRALEENRFDLYQQTFVPLGPSNSPQDGLRLELLLRLRDESGAIVQPGAFLPAAERYGLATDIDRWVVSHALSQLAASPRFVEGLAHCAINLSGHSLVDKTMGDFIEAELQRTAVPPQVICFEVTETAAIANLAAATALFGRLKALGCTFALDDFGSGLSSFAYLKTLSVDYLKIDGAFVKDIADDPIDRAMVKSINELGHVTGKQTIAEFAESIDVIDILRELGVDYAQGYGISRPEPFSLSLRRETSHLSGSGVALLPPRPLRTERASFPALGSSLDKAP